MTTTTAAIVLAWIAIILLTLATAGLLRRVEQLSSRRTLQDEPDEPIRGLQLPVSKYLNDLEDGRADILLVFASPSCATCQAAIDAVAVAITESARYRVGVAIREADVGPLHLPDGFVRLTSAAELFQILRVPATPYLVRLDPDGLIIDGTMMVGSLSLEHWLAGKSPITRAA
jgi:hypothetical protein